MSLKLGSPTEATATVRGKKGLSPYEQQQRHRQVERAKSSQFPDPPKRTPEASQSSIWGVTDSPSKTAYVSQSSSPHQGDRGSQRQSRHASAGQYRTSAPSPSPRRPSSRNGKRGGQTGSVRSAPPQAWVSQGHGYSPDVQSSALPTSASSAFSPTQALALSMTPDNLKPLLENAKEVHARCAECIGELKILLSARRWAD